MDDLNINDVMTFVRVVEAGSLTAAARRGKTAKSSVSRCLARLEERLGVRLLQRNARSVALTEAGRTYYRQVSANLAGILEASSAASASTARGTVRVSAPDGVGIEVLPELSRRFMERYPGIALDFELSAAPPNLLEQSLDLAIVGGPVPDSAVVMRKLRETNFRLYASPHYLARAGVPKHVDELEGHECVLFFGRDGAARWALSGPEGDVAVAVRGRVNSNSLTFSRRAAIAGAGIALLPEIPASVAVRRGQLCLVLPALAMTSSPLFLIYPYARHLPERVRLFRDFVLEHFPSGDDFDGAALD